MSAFRTVRASDPRFEKEGLRFVTVKSKHLLGRGDICIFVPKNCTSTNLPIVILLHGVYGSCWSWAMSAGAHLTAARMIQDGQIQPVVLAMPSDGLWGDGSAYVKHSKLDFEKWIAEDVPKAVQECVPETRDTKDIFISGLSMGGFGALRVGAKYHEVFSGISAHSAITGIDQMPIFVEEDLEDYKSDSNTDDKVFDTIRKYRNFLPPLRFDCGTRDILIDHNRQLHNDLEEAQIPHLYEEFEGQHEWSYWENHLKDSLSFFNKILSK